MRGRCWPTISLMALCSGRRRSWVRRKKSLHRVNTSAAPTPVTDGERLYVYFGSDLAALDLDGNVLWQQTIDPKYQEYSRYGASSSPVLTEEAVVILQDREYADTEDSGWLAAYSKVDASPALAARVVRHLLHLLDSGPRRPGGRRGVDRCVVAVGTGA